MLREADALTELDLRQSKEIGFGATSTVYLLPDGTVCKLFHPEFSRDEIVRESRAAEIADALGIRVPKPYGLAKSGDRLGIRSEYITGGSLAEILSREPERLEALLPGYLRELRRFHETEAAPGDFASAKELYLDKLQKLEGSAWYTADELEKMRQLVLSVPDRSTLLYGDYHPQNILMQDGELVFVDLGDTCLGHPVFDFAMMANTHYIIPKVNPAYAEKYFAVPAPLMLRLWDDVFAGCFSIYSPEEQSRIRRGIMAFAVLRQGLSPADGRVFPEPVLAGNVAAAKKRLLPGIEEITGSITW